MRASLASRRYLALLLLITLFGAWLRARGIAWGLPDESHPKYSYHQDEAFLMRCALSMSTGEPVGANFLYGGTLYFSVLAAYHRYAQWFADLLGGSNALANALLFGRICTVAFSTLSIPLAGALGRRASGAVAGLAAALLLALAPAHAFLAITVRPDEFAATLALLVTLLAVRDLDVPAHHQTRSAIVMGLSLGALMATRLPLGVFGVAAVAASWARYRIGPGRGFWPWLFGRSHVVLVAATIASYFLLSPQTITYPELFREGMGTQWQVQSGLFEDAIGRGPRLYQYGVPIMIEALGLPAYVLFLAGAVIAARTRAWPARVVLIALLGYFALTPLASWVVVRYVLPIVALACVLAGVAVARGLEFESRFRTALMALAGVGILMTLFADLAFVRVPGSRDARDLTTDWLRNSLAPGTSVVTFRQYEFDQSSNPVVPVGLVDSPFPLYAGLDPRILITNPYGQVLVVNDETYRNIERLGDAHPREQMRQLGAVLAPGRGFELVAMLSSPVRFAGLDFSAWFHSQDFRILRPSLRVYRRRA